MKPFLQGEIELEAPFHDVDMMGFVWHGHYVKYLELARTAMMREAGLDWAQMQDWGVIWPVVTCSMKYVRPLRYGQRFRVACRLLEYEDRIRIDYRITDAGTGETLHKAETVQLAVEAATGQLRFGCPDALREALAGVAR
ncbi:acyl-CoA thioesterase [Mesoterricola sediminis]|uniref:4-hydroxybenzoyl-CoA thioesterase n=1 Tax=Mesoterricola sediminis TaxID=2927980 RepID=A0AA48KCU2_9BACT|nr:thioesterase family protein [Mesoterricola sediminis]BDU75682.1 4-hydroxybenzoyl-CoA thioesterase [Mesoterricola sediminis]